MTPAQARAFHAVAVAGSFTAAARALNLSQPTLTHQVKLIESRYNVELFHRTARGVQVTETGARLLSIVRRMFGSYDEAVAFLDEVHGMRQGHLRIGSYEPYALSRVLARFVECYPGIQIGARLANSPELAEMLADYEVDVAVLASGERRDEFVAVPFQRPRLIVIAPRIRPWADRPAIRPAELADQTLIVREAGSAARQAFEKLLLDAGISHAKSFEFSSREGVLSAVAAGLGLSAVFDEGLVPDEHIVRLPIRGSSIHLDVQLMYLKERRDNAPIRAFLEIAKTFASRA
jgi:LysR family transcriptional regulator, low CO2-responsive transcriptional regulator